MITQFLLPAALAFIMFALGLGLVPADFKRVFDNPKAMATGLLAQVIGVCLVGLLLALLVPLPPALSVGIVILAACPGGVSSGLLTRLANGDTALSISLTAISSLLAVVSVPLIVQFAMGIFLTRESTYDFHLMGMVRGIFLLTTLPVVLGMLLRHFFAPVVIRWEPSATRLATLCFVFVVVATFVDQHEIILANLAVLGLAMMTLNVLTMALGFGIAQLTGIDKRGQIAVAMECGLQNAALGMFVASSVIGDRAMAAPSIVYALLMNIGAIAMVLYWQRKGGVPGIAPR
jgi:BASS family bile acid:Na+ symporter